jgi:hypothetical protein
MRSPPLEIEAFRLPPPVRAALYAAAPPRRQSAFVREILIEGLVARGLWPPRETARPEVREPGLTEDSRTAA